MFETGGKDCRVGSEIGHIRVLDENTARVRYFLPCQDLQMPAWAVIFAPMEKRNEIVSPDEHAAGDKVFIWQ